MKKATCLIVSETYSYNDLHESLTKVFHSGHLTGFKIQGFDVYIWGEIQDLLFTCNFLGAEGFRLAIKDVEDFKQP